MTYTAVPNKSPLEFKEPAIFEKDGYSVHEAFGRLFLIRKGYKLAELVGGHFVLRKTYRNDFNVWIEKTRAKDIEKIETIKLQIQQMQDDCSLILSIHN